MALPQDPDAKADKQVERPPSGQLQAELKTLDPTQDRRDLPAAAEKFREPDAEQYLRFSPARKACMVAILSYCSFLAPISSTSILSAIPEVASTYDTSGSVVNASNALYLAFMGIAAPFWGPFSQVWGRRPVSPNACQSMREQPCPDSLANQDNYDTM